jgi:outer membrane receptor protein involved in Fe transport
MSVTAFTSQHLEDIGANNFHDYARSVPSLSFIDRGPGRNDIRIRGISPLVGESAVGIYIDGIAASSQSNNPDLNLYDVDSVQILRGPQGTLYGEGALGGAILLTTKPPDSHEWAVNVDGQYLNQEEATAASRHGYALNAMINIPIIEDRLAFRATGGRRDEPGFIDWVETTREGDPIEVHPDQNYSESWNGRFALRLDATDDLAITARYTYQDLEFGHDNSIGDGLTQELEEAKYEFWSPFPQPGADTISQASIDIGWQLPWFKLDWISGFHDRDQSFLVNATIGQHGTNVGDLRPEFDNCRPLEFSLDGTGQTITSEARLSSTNDTRIGPFNWLAGVYYKDRSQNNVGQQIIRDCDNSGPFPPFFPPPPKPFPGAPGGPYDIHVLDFDVDFQSQQISVFGDVVWGATDNLSLSVGLRFLRDTVTSPVKTRSGYTEVGSDEIIPGSELGVLVSGGFGELSTGAEEVYQALTPKFGADYHITDDFMAFGNVAQGFRTGGINIGASRKANGDEDPATYDPDTAWSFELGFKSDWFDNRLTLNSTGFLILWDEIQAEVGGVGGIDIIRNLGTARSVGMELELVGQPVEGLTLIGGMSYVDSRITEDVFLDPSDTDPVASSGNLLQAPPWQGSVSAQYVFPITSWLDGVGLVSATYTDAMPSGVANAQQDDPSKFTSAYWIANLRVGVEGRDWGLYVFANNFLNEYAIVETDILQSFINRPRVIGLNFRIGFSTPELDIPGF